MRQEQSWLLLEVPCDLWYWYELVSLAYTFTEVGYHENPLQSHPQLSTLSRDGTCLN